MKKHSFQKGDRVVGLGVKGVYERPYGDIDDNEHLIRRDDGEAEVHAPFWWFDGVDLQHDRDFCVADWVRYECVKPMPLSHLLRDGMQGKVVECLKETVSVQFSENGGLFVLKDNLIKIAPPAEEKVDKADTAIIEHDRWGRVEGVERDTLGAPWAKNGACYYPGDGWREVKPKRWVPVECEKIGNDTGIRVSIIEEGGAVYSQYYSLPKRHRWKTVEIEREISSDD